MIRLLMISLVVLMLAGCIRGGGAQSNSGDAQGGAGVDVEVYRSDDSIYFEANPGGTRELRQQYRDMLSTVCLTPQGSCRMAYAIAVGAPCFCDSAMGRFYGSAI